MLGSAAGAVAEANASCIVPVGSRKSGRSGVGVYNARLGAWGSVGWTAAALALLASARPGGGRPWDSVWSPRPGQKSLISGTKMLTIFDEKVARTKKHKSGGPSQNAMTAHVKKHKDICDEPVAITTKCCK